MAEQVKRLYFDFVCRDYTSASAIVQIVSAAPDCMEASRADYAAWEKGKAFTLRCYMSLQGETAPSPCPKQAPGSALVAGGTEQGIYRYDWAFGVTLIEGFWWDWMKELPDESALAIHLLLKPHSFETGPEAVPIAATLSTLHPSRNTKSLWEQALPLVPKTAAEMAKTGASAFPLLNYLSSGLMFGSNVLASYTDNQKNWFLYQFLDEKQKCPVIEWRINRKVLVEFGPLIRGTVFLAFHNSRPGAVRMGLRPQLRYNRKDDISFIAPTEKLGADQQIFIDVRSKAQNEAGVPAKALQDQSG